MTVILCGLSFLRFRRASGLRRKPRRIARIALSALGILALTLTALLAYALPIPELPAPTGRYAVGTQTFQWTDMNRKDPFAADPGENRELLVQVWYPAEQQSNPALSSLLTAEERQMLAQRIGVPALLLDYLKYTSSHAAENAEVAGSRTEYPLILFNHGYSSSRLFHTSQAAELASHGFIVASIDHTYGTFGTILPDGTMKPFRLSDKQFENSESYRDYTGQVWSDDISYVIDQFERLNDKQTESRFGGRVDMGNVGVIGHSFGGAASYDALSDPRITAGINMDGTLFGFKDQTAAAKPFMFLYSEAAQEAFHLIHRTFHFTDAQFEEIGITREQFEAEADSNLQEMQHLRSLLNNKGEAFYIAGTGHLNYTDLPFISPLLKYMNLPGMTGKLNPERTAKIVNETIVSFFREHLMEGQDGNAGAKTRMPELRDMTVFR
ncbi:alpha/beta hydrolase family protein [Paenibacillus soyae]|uniref:Dienelactone hydrolase n=1 Tax=Paenibacillus soyae TaxID=2969249 RepID=A0A9X2MPC3_9BACL|nr:hypothetical protein [Paenibacillus soyae]MCR2803762.1 hypothetical protein [Paenibacillus soyae]